MKDGEKQRNECTDYLCDTSAGGLVITSEGLYIIVNNSKIYSKRSMNVYRYYMLSFEQGGLVITGGG